MSNFLLGPLEHMHPVAGVQRGAGISPARIVQETRVGSGAVFSRRSRYAPRTWTLTLRPWSTPESVRHLVAAASGETVGALWLYDRAAARANALHAHQTHGQRRDLLTLAVDGSPMRSFVSGGTPTQVVVDVPADASTYVRSSDPTTHYAWDSAVWVSSVSSGLLRFALPAAPSGMTGVSAELVMTAANPGDSAVSVRRTTGGWTENGVTYSTSPSLSGTVIGTLPQVALNVPSATPLPMSPGDLGAPLYLALTTTSSGEGSSFYSRRMAGGVAPVLRLTFTVLVPGEDAVVRVPMLGGQPYTISGRTSVTAGPILDYAYGGSGGGGINSTHVADGRFARTITPASDAVLAMTIRGDAPGLVSGLRVAEGEDDGSPWIPGHGAWARVEVDDPQRVAHLALAGAQPRSDYTVSIHEVGTPGGGV